MVSYQNKRFKRECRESFSHVKRFKKKIIAQKFAFCNQDFQISEPKSKHNDAKVKSQHKPKYDGLKA
jgi:hypothetical protein